MQEDGAVRWGEAKEMEETGMCANTYTESEAPLVKLCGHGEFTLSSIGCRLHYRKTRTCFVEQNASANACKVYNVTFRVRSVSFLCSPLSPAQRQRVELLAE